MHSLLKRERKIVALEKEIPISRRLSPLAQRHVIQRSRPCLVEAWIRGLHDLVTGQQILVVLVVYAVGRGLNSSCKGNRRLSVTHICACMQLRCDEASALRRSVLFTAVASH